VEGPNPHAHAMPQAPTLAESLKEYSEAVPEADRPDALHQLFYGFYSRIAILDRTTHELARWAKEDITAIDGVTPVAAEALRDNAVHVGRDLFAARVRTMKAMKLVSEQLAALCGADDHPPFTLERAVAFDEASGELRTYDLSAPGEHDDLPYDPFTYDPNA
jgi:hypothetical protein